MAAEGISAAQVKALREATGMGMMECKKALVECAGDFDKAQDWLRVKSGAKADKVSARAASEGRIAFAAHGGAGALVEISCETDFVARDGTLADFAAAVAAAAAQAGAAENPGDLPLPDGKTAEEARTEVVMKLGENINIRRVRVLTAAEGEHISHYIHNGDKIGAMCAISKDAALGRDICMHVAAMRPQYLGKDDVPAEVLQREMEVFAAQAREAGKADKAEQIAAGKLHKRLAELTLLPQAFIKEEDGKTTVAQVLEKAGATVRAFALLTVGGAE